MSGKENQWWVPDDDISTAADSFRVGCMIAVNTPYFIGSICAIILNLVIPTDLIDDTEIEIEESWQKEEGENRDGSVDGEDKMGVVEVTEKKDMSDEADDDKC